MAFGFDSRILLAGQQPDVLGKARSMADLLRTAQTASLQREQHQHTLASMLAQQQQDALKARIYSQHGAEPDAVAPALAGAGFGAEALNWLKQGADTRRLAATESYNADRLAQRDQEMEARAEDRKAQRAMLLLLAGKRAEEKKETALGDNTRELRKEINKDPRIAKYRQAAAELQSLEELAKDSTGANDMALVFAFMKAMDPESVVRESEYAAAAATGRPDERMMGLVSKYWTGGKLSDGQRRAFIAAARAAQSGHKAAFEKALGTYRHSATKRGYDLKELGIEGDAAGGATPPGLSAEEAAELQALEAEGF